MVPSSPISSTKNPVSTVWPSTRMPRRQPRMPSPRTSRVHPTGGTGMPVKTIAGAFGRPADHLRRHGSRRSAATSRSSAAGIGDERLDGVAAFPREAVEDEDRGAAAARCRGGVVRAPRERADRGVPHPARRPLDARVVGERLAVHLADGAAREDVVELQAGAPSPRRPRGRPPCQAAPTSDGRRAAKISASRSASSLLRLARLMRPASCRCRGGSPGTARPPRSGSVGRRGAHRVELLLAGHLPGAGRPGNARARAAYSSISSVGPPPPSP